MKNIMATPNKIHNLLHLFYAILIIAKLLGGVVGQHYSRCVERERQALLQVKDELVGEYGGLSSWGVGINKRECCKWKGVHCHNITNHVTKLNLRAPPPQELKSYPFWNVPPIGKISSSLLELKHLTYLDLSNNYFGYSSVPEFIDSFEKLRYLNLSNAYFHKSIPPSVGNLSELIYLDFSGNYGLYSDNLDWLSRLGSLKFLDLSGVGLGNASNWLQSISKLTSIKELHLKGSELPDVRPSSLPLINASAPLAILDLPGNDHFSSSMFQWFLNFSKSLTFIDLSDNNVTDLLSADGFDDQFFLEHLDLSYNNLEFGIPKSFGNMSNLVHLDLRWNHLTSQLSELMMNLSGPLEKKLQYLELSGNMISGSLPNFSRFSFLNHLGLRQNKLNGSIVCGFLNLPYLTDLVLGSNNLEGLVTESHLFNLSRLQKLDLSSNSLLTVNCSPHWVPPFQLKAMSLSGCKTGPRFPQWLQFQRKLQFLDISNCQIAESIPQWFGKITSRLMHLNASNNDIHGIIPESFFKLTSETVGSIVLDLSRNKIRGQVTFFCHNEAWEIIDLSDNLFSGHLPNCFTSMAYLNLADNHFVGEIPNSICSSEWFYSLNLRNNSLSGGIPTSLRNCKSLDSIDLGENMLTGNIPTWIGDALSQLLVLSMKFNYFNGTIPLSICRLQKIQVLDLSSNMISGPIPKCLYNLSAMTKEVIAHSTYVFDHNDEFADLLYDSLRDGADIMWKGKEVEYVKGLLFVKHIDLSNNLLVGNIPSDITKLDGLVNLNLSRNHLCGQIPPNIGDLKDLGSLDLSRNHISGSIPLTISELSSLGVLDLSCNNLSGRIPPGYTKFDESAYAENYGLCGRPVLNKSCPGEDESSHQDSNFNNAMNNREHEDDEFITKGFYICIVFGFVIGFWGIIGTIIVSNSARFAYFKFLNAVEDFVYVRVELSKARFRNRFGN